MKGLMRRMIDEKGRADHRPLKDRSNRLVKVCFESFQGLSLWVWGHLWRAYDRGGVSDMVQNQYLAYNIVQPRLMEIGRSALINMRSERARAPVDMCGGFSIYWSGIWARFLLELQPNTSPFKLCPLAILIHASQNTALLNLYFLLRSPGLRSQTLNLLDEILTLGNFTRRQRAFHPTAKLQQWR